MLYKLDDYIEKKSRKGESKSAFIKRVLVKKFGRSSRSWYRDKIYIHTSKNGDKALREIGE